MGWRFFEGERAASVFALLTNRTALLEVTGVRICPIRFGTKRAPLAACMTTSRWLSLWLLFVLLHPATSRAATQRKTFPILKSGLITYTNATVTDVSGETVSLRHAGGITSVRVDTLEPQTLAELGLPPRRPRPAVGERVVAPERSAQGAGLERAQEPAGTGGALGSERTGRFAHIPKLEGVVGVIVFGFAAVGLVLMVVGKIMFIVAAFQASPWWGVGVLLGGLTCGIVPLIFLFTHLEESKKAFLCALSGFLLVLVVAIATPNYLRAKAAAANAQPAIAAP